MVVRKQTRGFTLFELTIVVLVIGLISVVAIPAMVSARTAPGLRAAANMLAADIEYCQSACINTPQALQVVQFDTTNNKYWVALASSPNTPSTHPADGLPYSNDFQTGRSAALNGVSISGAVLNGGTTLAFDAYGRPQTGGVNAVITLSATNGTVTVTVDGATGDISIGG